MCGRTHPGKCYDGQKSYFKYGKEGHFLKEYPKNKQGSGNLGNRAQYSLVSPADGAAPRGITFGNGIWENRLYAITSRQEKQNSLGVVIVMIEVFTFDVYALLDQKQVYLL